MLKENYENVKDDLQVICRNMKRDPEDLKLIAVSKTKPIHAIQEVYDAGCRCFGENKVQELIEKIEALPKDIEWHMIGHLQRNKVKYIVGKVAYIHSVDSIRLAEEINAQAKKNNCTVKILLEINIAKETTKYGILEEDIEFVLQKVSALSNICVCGFMTVAPFTNNPEDSRIHFRNLHQLLVDMNHKNIDNINMFEISMGMSIDYRIAAEEGATMLRVGTTIFGERDYANNLL